MTEKTIEEPFIITYSNHLNFAGRKLAFRKKHLFDISGTPNLINESDQGWWIGRNLLSRSKAKELTVIEPVNVDVSMLQWYHQERLNGVFGLNS